MCWERAQIYYFRTQSQTFRHSLSGKGFYVQWCKVQWYAGQKFEVINLDQTLRCLVQRNNASQKWQPHQLKSLAIISWNCHKRRAHKSTTKCWVAEPAFRMPHLNILLVRYWMPHKYLSPRYNNGILLSAEWLSENQLPSDPQGEHSKCNEC